MLKGGSKVFCLTLLSLVAGLAPVSKLQASVSAKKHAAEATPVFPASFAAPQPLSGGAKIVIILDDIGNQWESGKRSALLQGDVTLAILPFSPYAQQIAALAQSKQKEIMLHAPMEPIHNTAWSGGLTQDMDRQQIKSTLKQMIAAVPGATGVNNHMGSALTQNTKAMTWVMETLVENNLFFVDSRTTAQTQALSIAQKFNLPSTKRDVFLDNKRDIHAIQTQLSHALNMAKKNGLAIAIGHPYPETLTVLEQSLQSFTLQNVTLITASQALTPPPKNDAPHSIFSLYTSAQGSNRHVSGYTHSNAQLASLDTKRLSCDLNFSSFFIDITLTNLTKHPCAAAHSNKTQSN